MPTPPASPLRLGSESTIETAEHSRNVCDCDCLTIMKDNQAFKDHFTTRMKEYDSSNGHQNVAVLLLSWENGDLEGIDEEIKMLHDVFDKTFNYTVTVGKMVESDNAKLDIILLIANFMKANNFDNTLLIIYYAGHGRRADGVGLKLASKSLAKKRNGIILWEQVESVLADAIPDLLVIFDCCYAGRLAYPKSRGPHKIFDFIGSTQPDKTARGPGRDSFTSALIHALKVLASKNDGFTLLELLRVVQDYEHFKDKGQVPIEGWRPGGEPTDRRLKLRPLLHASNKPTEVVEMPLPIPESYHFTLRLNLGLSVMPSKEDISNLAEGLSELIRSKSTPIMDATWGMLAKKRDKAERWHSIVQEVMRRKNMSSPAQLSVPTPATDLSQAMSPSLYYQGSSTAQEDGESSASDAERPAKRARHHSDS